MNDVGSRPATYADVLAAPEHVVAEIIRGKLVTSPRPASPHAFAASGLGSDLLALFQRGRGGPGGWWILDEPELHFEADVLVPDLAGWRHERMPQVPRVPYFELAPDWVCEVLSPSTAAHDRADKLEIYADAQVAWAWLVDPIARTVEVFELRDGRFDPRPIVQGQAAARLEPFEAIELSLDALWLDP